MICEFLVINTLKIQLLMKLFSFLKYLLKSNLRSNNIAINCIYACREQIFRIFKLFFLPISNYFQIILDIILVLIF